MGIYTDDDYRDLEKRYLEVCGESLRRSRLAINLNKRIEDLELSLKTAKIVMKYYDKNKAIHPMLKDLATQWLEIND